jgi:hypothetical protein
LGIPWLRRRGRVFFASFAELFAIFAVKVFTAKVARDSAKFAKRVRTPRLQVETPAPPGFARSHWKGNSCRDFSARLCPAHL